MKGDKTKLLRGDGETSEVFVALAEIIDFGDIKLTKETFDDTTFDSPDSYTEIGSGQKKVEAFDLIVKYKKGAAVADLLRSDFDKDTTTNFRIEWNDDPQTVVQFKAFVTGVGKASPKNESVKQTFTFEPSGKLDWS
jgi:hypothetical protein